MWLTQSDEDDEEELSRQNIFFKKQSLDRFTRVTSQSPFQVGSDNFQFEKNGIA